MAAAGADRGAADPVSPAQIRPGSGRLLPARIVAAGQVHEIMIEIYDVWDVAHALT
jgi:hypothetical protein